jgi:hypothetical protein
MCEHPDRAGLLVDQSAETNRCRPKLGEDAVSWGKFKSGFEVEAWSKWITCLENNLFRILALGAGGSDRASALGFHFLGSGLGVRGTN